MEKEIGARLKHLRMYFKINQGEFSEPLGIDRSHIAGIEHGSRNPSEPLLRLISFIYCVNLTWLKTGEGEMFISPEKSIKTQVDHFGELAIVQAITNILAGPGLPENKGAREIPIETSPETLSGQAATLESMLQNIVDRFGVQSFKKAVFEILDIQDHDAGIVDVSSYIRRSYDEEPELKRMIDTLYTLFTAGDERLKNWASVQFDRSFPPDVVEEVQKKQKETYRRQSASEVS